jgi:RNA polymerase sigma-70 factor, ECF subfamily
MDSQTHVTTGVRILTDEVDWETVFVELEPRVYNFFRYRVGDDLLAQDLTAATFEKAWRRRMSYRRNLAAFSTWLFTIARNTAADHFRRSRQEIPLDELHDQAAPALVEDVVRRREVFSRLASLLAGLPTHERELIALKFGGRLNNRQIAKLTHLSESNVGTILSRTIQKLHNDWEVEDER